MPKRLILEKNDLLENPIQGIEILFDDLKWDVSIKKPTIDGKEYSIEMNLSIIFTENYPFRSPIFECDKRTFLKDALVCYSEYISNNWLPTKKVRVLIPNLLEFLEKFNDYSSKLLKELKEPPPHIISFISNQFTIEHLERINDIGKIYFVEETQNDYTWEALILGPKGTPYEGGKFILGIFIPKILKKSEKLISFRYKTKMFGVGVKESGEICSCITGQLRFLHSNFAEINFSKQLKQIISYLHPSSWSNTSCDYNEEFLLRWKQELFEKAQYYTELYAMDNK